MHNPDRRDVLRLLSGSALAAALPESIARALAVPAHRRLGSIEDVAHIVVLVQENRSFDHYFGTLRGVRGFEDPHPALRASGDTVWQQPVAAVGATVAATAVTVPAATAAATATAAAAAKPTAVLPFHPTAPDLGLQFLQDLAHDWTSTHAAWNQGCNDQWVPQKGTSTMAYLTRQDIPYHHALADAFTVCDAYHASLLGPTDPNRYYLWTGCVGGDSGGTSSNGTTNGTTNGTDGGPVIDNAEAGYRWTTFPERLQQAGIGWTVYQDVGNGLDAAGAWGWTKNPYIGNYGDNALLYFDRYRHAQPGDPLYDRARVGTRVAAGGTLFDRLRSDVQAGRLPQVSWIAAPEAYSEHPNWPPNYGAWYIAQVLDALTANPEVWSKTALFITYDENDGFFDHMPPPTPPHAPVRGASTVDTSGEFYSGDAKNPSGPYGLGPRVPMLVLSPWSTGGWVDSQVFDHTSILRFIERRFAASHPGLRETNISPWRRAVCGDLTSAFDFTLPSGAFNAELPPTAAYVPPDALKHPDYVPVPPADQAMPLQEPGQRPARALPYRLQVDGHVDPASGVFRLVCDNVGAVAACLQVRAVHDAQAPRSHTVGAGASLSDAWTVATDAAGRYDVSVHGPNGLYRRYRGQVDVQAQAPAQPRVQGRPDAVRSDAIRPDAIRPDAVRPARLEVSARHLWADCSVVLTLINHGAQDCEATVTDTATGHTRTHRLAAEAGATSVWPSAGSAGWYALDITVAGQPDALQRLAGHVETGRHSWSDPAIGSAAGRARLL